MPFKFAHMSDVHLGSWNSHPELREMSVRAFEAALDECAREGADFVLISGDLFDTALPPVDILRRAVAKLRECADKGMRVYAIAGSHDFSPTGRTMLHVLEDAGLITYAARHEEENGRIKLRVFEDRTGARICGVVGSKGALDTESFGRIDRGIENLGGFKIFMFHSAIAEFRPKNMEQMPAVPLADLPGNFDYYAAGHVHAMHSASFGKGVIIFPGPLFPTEFPELEKYEGGFSLVSVDDSGRATVGRKGVMLFGVASIRVSAEKKRPSDVQDEIMKSVEEAELKNKALLIKVSGTLASGKPTDIDFRPAIALAQQKGAFTVKKSTSGLGSSEFEEIRLMENMSTDEIERRLVEEHAGQMQLDGRDGRDGTAETIISLMSALKDERAEDETVSSYEDRIKENAKKVLGL